MAVHAATLTNLSTRRAASAIAMTLALLSVAMLFAALMLGYALLRFNSVMWPPMGMERADLFYPTLSTVLIVGSSLCYSRSPRYTLFLGIAFLVSQALLWSSLKASGLYASAGIFPSIIYGLTWTHAGHLLVALCFLLALVVRRERSELWIKNVGTLWHFLGIIWLILYLSVFVF